MAQAGWFKNTILLNYAPDYFFLTDFPDEEREEELFPEERLTLADEELLLLWEETLADDPELRRDETALEEEREEIEGELEGDLRLIVDLDPEYLELPAPAELEPVFLLVKERRDGEDLEDRLLAEELFVLELDDLLKVEGSEAAELE